MNKIFLHSSVGKESAYNAGDPGLIPGSGRSAREGIGYPLQYSWASLSWLGGGSAGKESDCNAGDLGLIPCCLIAQLVKNLPTMQETLGRFLGREDPLEKGKATHSSVLGLPLWLS